MDSKGQIFCYNKSSEFEDDISCTKKYAFFVQDSVNGLLYKILPFSQHKILF